MKMISDVTRYIRHSNRSTTRQGAARGLVEANHQYRGKKVSLWKSPNFRLSLSLSGILLLHRILFRFFTRLRAHLLTPEARPFRQRNKKTTKTLTSTFAPAVGAGLAGCMLAVYPSEQLRVTITIYALSRAAESAYNLAEEEGWIWGKEGSRWERPWWWGSWLIFPLTCGQLLHSFIFDRDCFPQVNVLSEVLNILLTST